MIEQGSWVGVFRRKACRAMAGILIGLPFAAAQNVTMGRVQDFYPTGDMQSSVLAFERMAPLDIRAGTEFEYTLVVRNLTGATLQNVTLTEHPAEGLRVLSVSTESQSAAAGERVWNIASIEPRGSRQVSVRAIADRVGEVTACASVTFQNRTCARLRIVQPQLTLQKEAPAEVIQCDPIPIRLTVGNPGTGVASNVVVRDTLPEGWSADNGRRDVVINVGDLSAGQSRDYTVMARASRTGSFENCAMAEAAGGLTAKACANTRVVVPKLELAKTAPADRYVGRPAKFELTVRNSGDAAARDLQVVDAMPEGLRFMEASDGGRMSGAQLVWALGALNPGESRTVSFTAIAERIGAIRNTASAKAYCAEAVAEATLNVKGIPAILLEVVDLADPIEVGAQETYEIRVLNQGTAIGTGIVIQATLPKEQIYVSAEGPTQHSPQGQVITFAPLASLAPGQTVTYRVTSKGTGEGDVRFAVQLTSDQLSSPVNETESTHIY